MITQGYPLWAVESDGRVYAVVGWDEYQYPFLLILGQPGTVARNPLGRETFTFTTTDPTAQTFSAELVSDPGVDPAADSDRLADLVGRLVRLADGLETSFRGSGAAFHAAARIREELAK